MGIRYADSGAAGTLTTNWENQGGRLTTPANAAKMRILLYDYMNSGWVAYDDISLRQVSSINLAYDAENRLVGVSGSLTAIPRTSGQAFYYDGDGNRVKGTVAGVTTTYIGNPSVPSGQAYFEWTGSTSTMKKYYYAGSVKVAMRTGASTLNFLLGDHLNSNAITTGSNGIIGSETRYYPWGTTRYTSGTSPTIPRLRSGQAFQYTGQRVESSLGLLFYNARWSSGRAPGTPRPGAGEGNADIKKLGFK
jgi:hypothetical protein